MKFTASSALLAGAALLSTMSAVSADGLVQVSAKPLIVKPGGIVTVTMNFVVDNLKDLRRLDTTTVADIRAGLSTDPSKVFGYGIDLRPTSNKNNDTKNHTGKHADDTSITIKSARIFPNNFRPKVSADIDEEENVAGVKVGETATIELDEDDVILDKEYKITYKVRVGRGVKSGSFPIPVAFQGPNMFFNKNLEVLVK